MSTTIESKTAQNNPLDSLQTAQPGQLLVQRRDGRITPFDPIRIETAIKNAFIAVEGTDVKNSDRIQRIPKKLANEITQYFHNHYQEGYTLDIEAIQDRVVCTLTDHKEYLVLRAYIIYREDRRRARASTKIQQEKPIHITLDDGSQQLLDTKWFSQLVLNACQGIENVDPAPIITNARKNLFEGVGLKNVFKSLTLSARTLVENEPNYSYVTARLLLHDIYREVLIGLSIPHNFTQQAIMESYPACFQAAIQKGIEHGLLDPCLKDFDLNRLGQAIQPQRDHQFSYLGLQTLYDRYFIHHQKTRIELPQVFLMRVAMGLAHCEGKNRNQYAIEFYELLSSFDYMSSTPTLFNSGTPRPQLSSCFLSTVPDDLEGIFNAIRDNALLSKFAGGLGNDWTPVRGMGAHIKGTNGQSQGMVPFLKVANDATVAVNQGGKRKGALCAYAEIWHFDIEEFEELRKNTGDERRRTHDMNTANWIPDLFMKRLFEDKDWTLFSPDETPDLHELYGDAFEKAYIAYEGKAQRKEIRSKTIAAKTLWRKMLSMLFETGHPWMTFKDTCNIRSPQQHAGVIHSSNLCTEITLNTSLDEIAVCNLGSINLVKHMQEGQLDLQKLEKTIKTAIRMLDNVIDINYYSVPQARRSNLRHRPIGLGLMGFQDTLYLQKIPYASPQAVEFADRCMEYISYYAISASIDLAIERGAYETFKGSLWGQGILPIDSVQLLKKYRGKYLEQNTDQTLDWELLRKRVQKHGIRNSNVLAIAPTATISNICGVSQSIEPTYQNLFVKSNLSGEFTIINPYLVDDLKQRGLWDKVMVHDLKYHNGSVQKIERIPADLKNIYATAFEIEPKWLVEAASRRQKWIDQAQSLNLYMAEPSGTKLDTLYRMAWLRGLKTTYYLRTMGASNTEKATITDGTLNSVKINQDDQTSNSCAIDNPDCEACQ